MTVNVRIREAQALVSLEDPIIVAGAPRSGVRVMASLLSGHAAIASGPQLPFLVSAARHWHDITTKLGTNHARHYGVEPERVREAFQQALLGVYAGRACRACNPRPLIHSYAAGATLGIFADLFPGAKFVFCVRDVRASAASLLSRDWTDPRTGARLAYTLDAVAAGDFWLSYNKLARPCVRGLARAGRLKVVRYEDLCEKPGRTLKELSDFLALSPIARNITPEAAATVALSDAGIYPPASPGALARDHLGKWRTTLTKEQQKTILDRTGALNTEFGYA
jgi:hypothetical protein